MVSGFSYDLLIKGGRGQTEGESISDHDHDGFEVEQVAVFVAVDLRIRPAHSYLGCCGTPVSTPS